jgi:hypothetical protein
MSRTPPNTKEPVTSPLGYHESEKDSDVVAGKCAVVRSADVGTESL